MKRVLCLILVFVSLFALASCSSKKKNKPEQNDEKPSFEEEVAKEIPAEEGGTITNSDESVAIEIPAGALESDTTITMRIYDAEDYPGTEDKTVISKVVEFEPTGTIFKKPVFISMISTGTGAELRAAKKKVVTAAVYKEEEGQWSYSKTGAAVKVSKDAAGDPIMTTAAGDPIMLSNGNLTTAAGDPIMNAAAGDPIMVTAAGDPIMTTAAGDPIMMTTGHFTAYAFFFVDVEDEEKPVEEPTEEPGKDDEITDNDIIDEPVADDDEISDEDEIPDEPEDADEPVADEDNDVYVAECGNGIVDPDEACDKGTDNGQTACVYGETSCTVCTSNCQIAEGSVSYCGDGIVQSNEKCDKAETGDGIGSTCSDDCLKVYSKVLCTGMAICIDGEGKQILCPKEDNDFYGQDAQYAARKGCVPHSYTEIGNPEEHEVELRATVQDPPFIKDDVTGLTWWLTGRSGTYEEMKDECAVSYGGIEDWRLPEPQELASLADHGMLYSSRIDPVYFAELYRLYGGNGSLDRDVSDEYIPDIILTSVENYFYLLSEGVIARMMNLARSSYSYEGYLMCVSGEKYGEANAENYSTVTENGDEMVSDSATNLFWQKEPVKKATWKEALSYCENLEYAGHSDWRLPNMNELATLIDYSKLSAEIVDEDEVISSFPGMTPDTFWSSTPAPVDYYVWILYMDGGAFAPYGDYEGSGDDDYPVQPELKSIKRDDIAEGDGFSVLCVRSDLDERTEVPECDGTGTGPCKDENGTIWSSRLYPEIFADFDKYYISSYSDKPRNSSYEKSVYMYGVAAMCRYLNENGSNKWRLPTLKEIRKTVTTEKLKNGGNCGVTDEHFATSYFDEAACSGDTVSKTTLNDFGIILSGTLTRDEWDYSGEDEENPMLWGVDVAHGVLYSIESPSIYELLQRCVLDETLPDYVTAPYSDPATGLTWSELAPDAMNWPDAYDHCASLNTEEDPENFWRLPTTAELQTLLSNCEEDSCAIDLSGRYSLFGDISYSWTSDINEDETVNGIDFTEASISSMPIGKEGTTYYVADVRCVSGGVDLCDGNTCASVENATGRCLTNPESESGYSCECGEDYYWDNNECVKILTIE